MNPYKTDILEVLRKPVQARKIEAIDFPSGALIIDFWVKDDFYTIQVSKSSFGINQIVENPAFSTIPDVSFDNFAAFKQFLITSLKTQL